MSNAALAEAPRGTDEAEPDQPLKLFEVKPDPAPPTLITVNINGSISLDLSKKSDVDFYNSLQAGKNVTYETEFFVASTKKTHRRDKEGNVQATPESKSLVVDLVLYAGADE
jgi:hypothetical protein